MNSQAHPLSREPTANKINAGANAARPSSRRTRRLLRRGGRDDMRTTLRGGRDSRPPVGLAPDGPSAQRNGSIQRRIARGPPYVQALAG